MISSGWAAEEVVRPSVFDVIVNPVDSGPESADPASADSILQSLPTQLDELTIEATGRKDLYLHRKGGGLELRSSMLAEMPTLLGGGDVLSAVRSTAQVATAADLNTSFSVRGLPTGSSLFSANGIRIGSPMHLLGLYSTYVPGLFDSYILDTFPDVWLQNNTAAGVMDATSGLTPDTLVGVSACIGLIETHADVNIPISRTHPTSARIALRQTYLDKVFPGLLKAGSSTLGYAFSDGGMVVKSQLTSDYLLTVTFTGSRDRLDMQNGKMGRKEVNAGWSNLSGGASIRHSRLMAGVGLTYFKNYFEIEEGLHSINLPSSLVEVNAFYDYNLSSDWILHMDGHVRKVSGQANESLHSFNDGMKPGKSTAWELNPSAAWRKRVSDMVSLDLGLRMSCYYCGENGAAYAYVAPLPRVAVGLTLPGGIGLAVRYARLMRSDRLIEESVTGLPVNFFINSSKRIKPEDNHSIDLEISGHIPLLLLEWHASGYWIRMFNDAEYGGGLLNFINNGYDPLADLHFGHGYSTGFSLSLMRQWGKVRGRLNYSLGKSRVLIPYFSAGYFPSSSDRTHDLSVGLTWQILRGLTFASNFTYATGTPFTKARFGYIIGENLICEYYPHNSSRLPSYKRLDLSLSYRLAGRKISQEFNVSVYNALASRNTLFIYNTYSLTDGVTVKESVMRNVIPSVAYTISY